MKVSLNSTKNILKGSIIKVTENQHVSVYKNGRQIIPQHSSNLNKLGVSEIYTDKCEGKRFVSVALKDGRRANFYDAMSKEGSEKLNNFFNTLKELFRYTH